MRPARWFDDKESPLRAIKSFLGVCVVLSLLGVATPQQASAQVKVVLTPKLKVTDVTPNACKATLEVKIKATGTNTNQMLCQQTIKWGTVILPKNVEVTLPPPPR